MDVLSATAIRDRLENWRKRFSVATYPLFHITLVQFWQFVQDDPVLSDIAQRIPLPERTISAPN
jgi:hypothetical protein